MSVRRLLVMCRAQKPNGKQVGSGTLTPATPLVLEWINSKNVTFRRTVKLDDTFLFTIEEEVVNNSGDAIALSAYGRLTRFGTPVTANIFVLHEGLIGYFGEEGLQEVDYSDLKDDKEINAAKVDKGWLGITDKYWATAIVPTQTFTPRFAFFSDGRERFQSDFLGEPLSIAAGATGNVTHKLFAGAKKTEVIDTYEATENIGKFDLMIDWGWFYWITKPLFKVMNWLFHLVGNFGVAILLTTVLIKALLYPLANLSYASMAKMKKVQPEMQKIKEQTGDDRVKLQQEMMALYKKEKINPAAGCWPMLVQIPVFFALYKVLYVTIEMRHAPFFGWIQDLVCRRSDLDFQSVRPAAVGKPGHPGDRCHRRLAADHGHHHVPADADEPGPAGPDPGHDLQMDADRLHLHAGDLPCRSGDLLGLEQHAVDHSAGHHHA